MTNDEVNRWKLSAERIAELRGFIDQLLSTHNMYECIAIRDMLSEEITHEPSEQRLRTPLGEPALTHVDGLPGTRESVVIEPQGNADESPALFPQQMEPDTSPLTHQEMFSAIHSLAADIVRLTAAVPAQCTQGASRDASSEFVCPNHGPVQQLTDSGDCPMCYQDRHAQRT